MQIATIDHMAAKPAVREAAEQAASLIALWPLTDAKQLDNDAKYAEELQVRITRAFAVVMTGADVTMADAEFVYEGADEIPGRPQEIVDALLAANDAYDVMAEFGETGGVELLFEAASLLGVDWDETTCDEIARVVSEAQSTLTALAGETQGDAWNGNHNDAPDNGDVLSSGDARGRSGDAGENVAEVQDDAAGEAGDAGITADVLARRFAAAVMACHQLMREAARDIDDDAAARRILPVLLFVNELRERYAIPRICLTAAQIHELAGLRDSTCETPAETVADFIAPLAAAEWAKHREDVLWDPDEAKKRAKEEDERRNKEALAAKFAHVKDDPSKPHVEL